MQNGIRERPFRVQLIFYDELRTVQAVPLNGVPDSIGNEVTGGMLQGRDDVQSFILTVGIDSIVQTRQLSDLPNPAFEYIFHVRTANQIITVIQDRIHAPFEIDIKILEGEPITAHDRLALSSSEFINLGCTRLRSAEGFARMTQWFKQRPKSTS